jgi:hypothetical protein
VGHGGIRGGGHSLNFLDKARSLGELGAPAYRLHALKDNLAGYWSDGCTHSKAFGTTAELWMRLQTAYDLAQVPESRIKVQRYRKAS